MPKEEQEKRLNKTNIFKENNTCVGIIALLRVLIPKELFNMKILLKVNTLALKKYFKEKRRVNRNVNVYIFYFCGCSEGLASIDNIKI